MPLSPDEKYKRIYSETKFTQISGHLAIRAWDGYVYLKEFSDTLMGGYRTLHASRYSKIAIEWLEELVPDEL